MGDNGQPHSQGGRSGGAISLDAARARVLAKARTLAAAEVPLGDASGLRLAADVVAAERLQAFDNSAMDGYAVRVADLAAAGADSPVALVVVDESRAGRPAAGAVGPGEAIAISTGAMLPAGAEAVVRVEDTRPGPGSDPTPRVEFLASPTPGANVRRAGEDVAEGQTVLRAGDAIGPAALGLLAALGVERVACHRRPTVAVLSSGDELVPPGTAPGPGQIRDSNGTMLAALVAGAGAELHSVGHAADTLAATVAAIEPALAADAVIVAGGVSVGEHDHVKAAFAELGVAEEFWRVALKPGGPTWFGSRDETLVFGLPGNPVSAFATFTLLVRPALARLAGGPPDALRTVAALAAPYEKKTGRTEAIRATLELTAGGWRADPRPHQGSHVLTSLLGAGCLALIPGDAHRLEAGAEVEVEILDPTAAAPPSTADRVAP
jgi:molybdopterin molybdotransferase